MSASESISWNIDCYGRYLNSEKTVSDSQNSLKSNGTWKYFDASTEKMKITLQNHSHLVLMQGSTILESHSIVGGIKNMTGLYLDDSMLFMHRSGQNSLRRFRVKFTKNVNGQSPSESCLDCVNILSKIFPIKQVSFSNGSDEVKEFVNMNTDSTIMGDISLAEMAQIITKKDARHLAEAYQHSHLPACNIRKLLQLCLADPNFPAFVEQVEQQLETLSS